MILPWILRDRDGNTLAIVLRKGHVSDGPQFYTEPTEALQVGSMRWPAGKVLRPHYHIESSKSAQSAEVLFIVSGRVKVDLWAGGIIPYRCFEVAAGDVLILLRGGHGFEFLEESVVWEVKTGPYNGDSDKLWI